MTEFYNIGRCIPWTDIAEHPSHHMSKKSRPDSDYVLEEPSHMKSNAVDSWLQHWLKLQKKNKRPLELRVRSDKPSESGPTPAIMVKRRGKKSKPRYVEEDDSDDDAHVDTEDNDGSDGDDSTDMGDNRRPNADSVVPITADAGQHEEGAIGGREVTGGKMLPISPSSVSLNRKSSRAFLESLSNDTKYRKLILLLYAAKVSI